MTMDFMTAKLYLITCFKCHGAGKYKVPVYGRYDELRYWKDEPCELCKCTGKISIEKHEEEQRKRLCT